MLVGAGIVGALVLAILVSANGSLNPLDLATFAAGAKPTITKFSPTNGLVGTAVTISGTSLDGVTSVTFNGLHTTAKSVSSTSISATVPAKATDGTITVTTSSGYTATSATAVGVHTFIVNPTTPTITSLEPESGAVGSYVKIYGSNLGQMGGNSAVDGNRAAVQFSGASSAITSMSGGHDGGGDYIRLTVPTDARTGVITVTVTTGGGAGTSSATSAKSFGIVR